MFKKLLLLPLGVLLIVASLGIVYQNEIGFCANKSNVESSKVVGTEKTQRLTYSVDEKKGIINFSKAEINLKEGESFVLKTSDLIVGGNIFENLDVDWKTANDTEYTFKGIKAGKTKVEFSYTKNNLKGYVNVVVTKNAAGKIDNRSLIKIYYRIKNDNTIAFSNDNLEIKKGQRIMLLPDPKGNVKGNLLVEGDYTDILSENYFFNSDTNLSAFKALKAGFTSIECHKEHEYFIKGSLKVKVIE